MSNIYKKKVNNGFHFFLKLKMVSRPASNMPNFFLLFLPMSDTQIHIYSSGLKYIHFYYPINIPWAGYNMERRDGVSPWQKID